MKTSVHSVAERLPQHEVGRLALRRLAASIVAANELAPDRWGLSCLRTFLRLNLGKIEVMTISPRVVRLLVASDALPHDLRPWPGSEVVFADPDDLEVGYYKTVPRSALCWIDVPDCEDLGGCLAFMDQSHQLLLRKAALTARNPMTAKSHSVSAIREIEQLLGMTLPQPRYAAS